MKINKIILVGLTAMAACGPEEPGTQPAPVGPPADVTVSRAVVAGAAQSFQIGRASCRERV